MIAVRARTSRQDLTSAAGTLVLLLVSVAFAVSGALSLPAVGGVVALVVGVPGIALFGARLVATAGRAVSGRPVLEVGEHGVCVPAAWPWSRARDRRLSWPEVASVVVWNETLPRGRMRSFPRVAFLPVGERAAEAGAEPGVELLALRLEDVPGTATLHWSAALPPRATVSLETVLEEVRRLGGVRIVDARSR
ncbi:hypothetical protein [Actinoallomurus soli]|uniref:hypothetical protein n=1 Tax=Actinoallomurus soli TaxID=2952535 RepID=UPI002093BB24|nr:hypothetical protein [Actinoallomurus soli]MCO5972007.1 hypothetical protein [Actinoallomurus soli]